MAKPTQAPRHIAIETPLGEDVLLLQSFSGQEEISRLFQFDLQLLSEDYSINFDDIIGQNVTIRLDLPDGGKRYWNGYISRFMKSGFASQQYARYQATLVPWLWFLTQTSDCRIFQEKTVPDIIKQIFSDLGFTDIEERLTGSYRTWTYCVQYRETDFNFVSRLMEQEGIYYYFLHENGKCTLVLCDSLSIHDPFPSYEEIGYARGATSDQERITDWTVEKALHSGKFAHTDYNFEKPGASLMSPENEKRAYSKADYEIYDYPGEYSEKAHGEQYAKVRMEELARSYEVCSGESDARGICPGHLFTLAVRDNSDRSLSDQAREYLVVSAGYQASAEDYETSGGSSDAYSCFFNVIPSSVQFRSARITPKPVVEGNQTAIVTGPSGEEIYTDSHGRIKVQFHWDREGQFDENSSCWIRVSQVHAGKGFGGIDIPRIGEEVIVSFIEGDPDRPIITGRVYNAELMPPFGLPGQKVVSGMKSNSTPGGGGYNEITLNDTKGKEGITVHGQYDMNTTVEHNQTNTVKNDFTETIINNATIKISDGNYKHDVATGTADYHVQGALTEKYDTTQDTTIKGNLTIKSTTGAIAISSDASHVKIDAATKITLHTGASTIEMDSGGNIKIEGVNITISGQSSVTISGTNVTSEAKAQNKTSGALVISEGSATNTVKGGVVMLNP